MSTTWAHRTAICDALQPKPRKDTLNLKVRELGLRSCEFRAILRSFRLPVYPSACLPICPSARLSEQKMKF